MKIMEKKHLVKLLNELLIPLGYVRKGNDWTYAGEHLKKVVNLQKSGFSNLYYINYGFIIPTLQLITATHVGYRMGGMNDAETQRIRQLLSLDLNIDADQRKAELTQFINDKVINKLNAINTEIQLKEETEKLPYASMVPLVVIKHFNLEDWWER